MVKNFVDELISDKVIAAFNNNKDNYAGFINEINKIKRKEALKYHPDRNLGVEGIGDKFKISTAVFDVITNMKEEELNKFSTSTSFVNHIKDAAIKSKDLDENQQKILFGSEYTEIKFNKPLTQTVNSAIEEFITKDLSKHVKKELMNKYKLDNLKDVVNVLKQEFISENKQEVNNYKSLAKVQLEKNDNPVNFEKVKEELKKSLKTVYEKNKSEFYNKMDIKVKEGNKSLNKTFKEFKNFFKDLFSELKKVFGKKRSHNKTTNKEYDDLTKGVGTGLAKIEAKAHDSKDKNENKELGIVSFSKPEKGGRTF
ncbi:MAG: hypothetical protein J0H68_01790 [Sphingobacteriia bacterium]|nr:hypothetical protein [Sphingobacteriia bacterium]